MDERAPTPTDDFVVRYDSSQSRRTFWWVIGAAAMIWVMLLLAVRSFAAIGGAAPAVFTWVWAALLAAVTAVIGFVCFLRGTSTGITQPWRVSARGILAMTPAGMVPAGILAMTPAGMVQLPWEAVSGVWVTEVGRSWRITIRPHADAAPGRGGVESDVEDWELVRSQGLFVGGPGVSPGRDEILAAIRRHAGDRVPIA